MDNANKTTDPYGLAKWAERNANRPVQFTAWSQEFQKEVTMKGTLTGRSKESLEFKDGQDWYGTLATFVEVLLDPWQSDYWAAACEDRGSAVWVNRRHDIRPFVP